MTKAKTSPVAFKWDAKTEAALKAAYEKAGKPNDTDALAELGKQFDNKTAVAIRGKLVSLGIYEKGEPKAVGGASSTRKSQIVTGIEILASMKKGSLESLEKASKPQLEALADALKNLSERHNADNGIKDPQPAAE